MPSYRWPNIEQTPKRVALDQPVPNYKYSKHFFGGCGVDNYTNPPAQDPEMFMQLTNVQPITDGTIGRRWGYTLWANPGITPSQLLFDYQSDISLARKVVATSPTFVNAYGDDGSTYQTGLFTPASGASAPRMVSSRSFAYFADNTKTDFLKWNGAASGGVTNWGIDVTNVTSSSTSSYGPAFPATVNDNSNGGGAGSNTANVGAGSQTSLGDTPWSSPNNITLNNASSPASVSLNPNGIGISEYLLADSFGFTSSTVPNTATILGITVSITRKAGTTSHIRDNSLLLMKGGTLVGTDHASSTTWPTSYQTVTYGSANDLWGVSWAPSDIQSSTFGVGLQAVVSVSTTGADVIFVQISVYYSTPTSNPWTNPNNVKADDGAVASSTANITGTDFLQTLNYFSTVAGTIQGIQVQVKCDYSGGVQPTLYAQLQNGSANYASVKQLVISSTSLGYVTFGGSNDLWGGTWSASGTNPINGSGFGVMVYATTSSSSCTINIDAIKITVYVVPTGFALGSTSGTGITLTSGRVYTYCFYNSSTGHYSDIGPFTASTGALSNQGQILTNIPKCNDTQVDTVVLLATADGGDETRLYQVTTLANSAGPQNYTDTLPETSLLANNVLLSTDANGNEFGVTFNDPPAKLVPSSGSGNFVLPTKHRGRIYLVNGPTLAWSKALEDVTTDSGFVAGKWEEAFPPQNALDISEGAESVRGMLSDGINLYLGTEFRIRRLNGGAPFIEPPDVVHNGVGLLNQDVWQIVFRQGTPVGAMWVTPDQRIIMSDFNTYQDVGLPVQTTLNSVNTSVSGNTSVWQNVARASFYSNGPNDWYVLAVPTGSNTYNDTLLVYDLRQGQWFVWNLTDNVSEIFWHVLITGQPSFLIAASTGKIYQLTPFSTQDRLSDTPVNFTSTVQTSWLPLGDDPVMRKALNELEVLTDDNANLLVSVESATTHTDFASPFSVLSSANLLFVYKNQYKVFLAGATNNNAKFYRFTFSSNSAVAGLLQGYIAEVCLMNRI